MDPSEEVELRRLIRAIRSAIEGHMGGVARVVYGTVKQVSPLEVLIDGSVTQVPAYKHKGYAPTLDDRVFIHMVRGEPVVADAIG